MLREFKPKLRLSYRGRKVLWEENVEAAVSIELLDCVYRAVSGNIVVSVREMIKRQVIGFKDNYGKTSQSR